MRAWCFLIVAACSSSDENPSSFTATISDNGLAKAFDDVCELTAAGDNVEIFATNGRGYAFEIKWSASAINTPGTYTTGGIVADLSLFALYTPRGATTPVVASATGAVTFSALAVPDSARGTFELTVPNASLTASGAFDCR
ncbi:MAG TPA: hypothetical protein VK427_21305 [Kofleriaceae bacterium]|nr:hypothetical protein [Kofleriaceae bacterium]